MKKGIWQQITGLPQHGLRTYVTECKSSDCLNWVQDRDESQAQKAVIM